MKCCSGYDPTQISSYLFIEGFNSYGFLRCIPIENTFPFHIFIFLLISNLLHKVRNTDICSTHAISSLKYNLLIYRL